MVRVTTVIVTYVTCKQCRQKAFLRTFRNKLQMARHKDMRRRRSRVARFNAPDCPSSNTANYDPKSMDPRQEQRMSF